MHYYFAPMEGVTGAVYRRTHHEFFSGVDKYFMPLSLIHISEPTRH